MEPDGLAPPLNGLKVRCATATLRLHWSVYRDSHPRLWTGRPLRYYYAIHAKLLVTGTGLAPAFTDLKGQGPELLDDPVKKKLPPRLDSPFNAISGAPSAGEFDIRCRSTLGQFAEFPKINQRTTPPLSTHVGLDTHWIEWTLADWLGSAVKPHTESDKSSLGLETPEVDFR